MPCGHVTHTPGEVACVKIGVCERAQTKKFGMRRVMQLRRFDMQQISTLFSHTTSTRRSKIKTDVTLALVGAEGVEAPCLQQMNTRLSPQSLQHDIGIAALRRQKSARPLLCCQARTKSAPKGSVTTPVARKSLSLADIRQHPHTSCLRIHARAHTHTYTHTHTHINVYICMYYI